MEQLAAINAALKSRGVRGRIVVVRNALFLRGTFTAADGTRKDRKICLNLPAHQCQLLEAENRVLALAAIVATTGIVPAELPWDAPAPISPRATLGEITVAEAVSQLERDFWQGQGPRFVATTAARHQQPVFVWDAECHPLVVQQFR